MAEIIINDKIRANGKFSFNRVFDSERNIVEIRGVFATHLYYEDIRSLESPRFKLKGLEIYEQSFGSDDYDILYHFIAKDFELKDVMDDGIGYILYGEEMQMIEDEMYKNDHPILGGIGEVYKNMIREED